MRTRTFIILLMVFPTLAGCSCQRQLERLQHRCPDCFTQTTAHVRDTLPIPVKMLQGAVPWAWLPAGDTVLIENRDITLQLLLDGDTLRVDVEVPPDTLYIDHEVTLPCPECDTRLRRLQLDVAVAAALVVLLFLWGIVRELRLIKERKSQ